METLYTYTAYFIAAFTGGEVLLFPIILAVKLSGSNIFIAMVVSFVGTLSRDWLLFLMFRTKGRQLLLKIPKLQSKLVQLTQIQDKNNAFILFFYRFFFGLVVLVVIALGLSGISIRQFATLSLVANMLFIVFVGGFGYYFTEFMIEKVNWVNQHYGYCILGFVFLFVIYLLVKKAGTWLFNRWF